MKDKAQIKPKGIPRPKRMTICIGMLASDGIVIAADAQESDQYYKRSQQKIMTFIGGVPLGENRNKPSMACAFTGAGEGGYVDAFIAEAIKTMPSNPPPNRREFEDFLATRVLEFHQKHLFPLASSNNPPEMQILVGAYVHWGTGIFVSYGSTLRHALPHAAIGAGAHFAMSLIDDLDAIVDVRRTELLAAYVVGITKERIEGCGKYTAIVSLHNPVMCDTPGQPSQMLPPPNLLTHVPFAKIRKWEESFVGRWAPRQSKLVRELVEEELATETKSASEPAPLPKDQIQS